MATVITPSEGKLYTTDYETFHILDPVTDVPLTTFTGAKLANKSLPGDLVRQDASGGCQLAARADHPPIVGVIETASKTRYGFTSRGIPIYLFVPADKAYPPFIVGCSEKDTTRNYIGLIKFDNWDGTGNLPRGALQKIIGPVGCKEAEEEALLWQYAPVTVHKTAGDLGTDDCPNRMPLTGFTFNIDPVGCRDVDDVITVDGKTITITIADVAARITELSYQDMVASIIGQTLYKDGAAVRPMLHKSFSEDALSLLPGKERLGVSLSFDWDGHTRSNFRWHETRLTNQRSFTYEEAVTGSCPEMDLLAAAAGAGPGADSHEWIAEMMKLYNLEAAALLADAGTGILRAHAAPDLERLAKYATWDPSLTSLAASAAKYVDAGAGMEATHHYGLAAAAYCHATSPIRRYADLMNQRILKQIIRGNKKNLVVSCSLHDLNLRAKAAKAYERDLCFLRAILTEDAAAAAAAGAKKFDGRILDIIPLNDGTEVKLRIWINSWHRTISVHYKAVVDGLGWRIRSRDEKNEYKVAEGDLVVINIATNMAARRWKDRLVVSVSTV